jgi:hypothetical protein
MAFTNGAGPVSAVTEIEARKSNGTGQRREPSRPKSSKLQFPDLAWKRGSDGVLSLVGHRRSGHVQPDRATPGMWRVQWTDGQLSDLTNLTRAKDALARFVESERRRERSLAEEAFRRPLVRQNGGGGS